MSDIQEYYESPRVNQSYLKSLIGGIHTLRQPETDMVKRIKSNALIIGSAVDCLVTDPDEWVNYHVIKNKVPTGQNLQLVELVVDKMRNSGWWLLMQQPPSFIIEEAYNEIGIKARSLDKVLQQFQEDLFFLYTELVNNYTKTWIKQEDFELVEALARNVVNHPHTRDIFDNDFEQLYQLAIYFEHEGVECKALLDILLIDHENKKIYPCDLKTTKEHPKNFHRAIDDHRYDIQARWYEYAVMSHFSDLILQGYTVEPFTFVVASKANPECPILVPLTFVNPEKLDEEIKRLIDKHLWYSENGYSMDMEIAIKNGVLPMNKYYS